MARVLPVVQPKLVWLCGPSFQGDSQCRYDASTQPSSLRSGEGFDSALCVTLRLYRIPYDREGEGHASARVAGAGKVLACHTAVRRGGRPGEGQSHIHNQPNISPAASHTAGCGIVSF